MSNVIGTIVKCKNPAVIMVCASVLSRCDICECNKWKPGDTDIHVLTYRYGHFGRIEVISSLFPDDIITLSTYDTESGDPTVITEEFRNGKGKYVDKDPDYSFIHMPLNNEKDREGIYDK